MYQKYIDFLIEHSFCYSTTQRKKNKTEEDKIYIKNILNLLKFRLLYVPYIPIHNSLKLAIKVEVISDKGLSILLKDYAQSADDLGLKIFFNELSFASSKISAKQLVRDSILLFYARNTKCRVYHYKGRVFVILRAFDQINFKRQKIKERSVC